VAIIRTRSEDTIETGAFSAMHQADFRWFLLGTTLTFSAQWIQQVTLNWLVFDLTASGTMLGTLNLVRAIATVGLAPLAGVVIDRVSQRKLMFLTNGWLLTISLILGISLLSRYMQIWPLFVFGFLGGLGQALNMPLRQTVTFALVPRSLAPKAIALLQTGWALMRSVGPAIGGFLLLWFGAGGVFLVQAAVYALITVTIIPLKLPKGHTDNIQGPLFSRLSEGLRFAMVDSHTRAFLLLGWVLPLFIIPIFTVLPPIYTKEIYHGGPQVLGILLSAVGVGGIGGGLVTASLCSAYRRGLLQLSALLLLSLSLIGFAFTTTLWVAVLMFALAGFFEMIYLSTNQTLLQMSIPDKLRGRVTGLAALTAGLQPLGALAAGIGADMIGAQCTTIILGCIAGTIAVTVYLLSPTVREYRLVFSATRHDHAH